MVLGDYRPIRDVERDPLAIASPEFLVCQTIESETPAYIVILAIGPWL